VPVTKNLFVNTFFADEGKKIYYGLKKYILGSIIQLIVKK
jgi:hypothetical protein